jgi:hypothetical protein
VFEVSEVGVVYGLKVGLGQFGVWVVCALDGEGVGVEVAVGVGLELEIGGVWVGVGLVVGVGEAVGVGEDVGGGVEPEAITVIEGFGA